MSTPTTATATTLPHYRSHHYPQYPHSHSYSEQQHQHDPNQPQQQHHQNPPSSPLVSASAYGLAVAQNSIAVAAASSAASGLATAPLSALAASGAPSEPTVGAAGRASSDRASASFSVAAPSSVSSPLPSATATATDAPIVLASTHPSSSTTNTNTTAAFASSFDPEHARLIEITAPASAAALSSAAPAAALAPTTTAPAPAASSSSLPCLNPNGPSNSAISSSTASCISLSSRLPPPYRSLPRPYATSYHSHSHSHPHTHNRSISNIRSHDYENYDYDYASHTHHSSLLQSPVHPPAHLALSHSTHGHGHTHAHNRSHNSAHNAYTDHHLSHQSQASPLSPSQQTQRPYSPLATATSGQSNYTASAPGPSASVTLPPLSSLPSVSALPVHNHHRLDHLSATAATASPPDLNSIQSQVMATSSQSSQSQSQLTPARKRRRSREPDWTDFYKNGLPKEIIVIDDDSPDTDHLDATTLCTPNSAALPIPHHPQPPHHDQQATKRRKRDDEDAVYDALYHNTKYSASHTTTPRLNATPNSHSDRTSALLNSSATSLSTHDLEAPQSGQKRKRATRQQIAHEARLKEAEIHLDSLVPYVPPPYPPRKAPDVHIRVVNDHYHRNHKVDDDDGHYIVVPDGELTERYQIVKLLGQGTFGKVVQARDRRRNKLVAIKIIRSVQKYRDASKIELRVLATLKANDEENRNRCIHLRDCFDFRNHICIVMDLLGQSVFDFLKSNNFVPFPNSQIQSFARQLFTSVAFLHDLNLIHTDLKPENILLCDNTYQTFTYNRKIPSASCNTPRQANQRRVLLDTEIRLIDFGSATFQDEYHSSVVSTRHYRAPEIILGLGWSYPCDIWSIGCILVEFFTGDALFQTHDNLEHLAMMEAVVGHRIDSSLVQAVNRTSSRSTSGNPAAKFFKRLRLDFPTPETSRASKRFVKAMKTLEDIIPANNTFLKSFLNLLRQIFVYDPAKRITAKAALQHPWFRELPNPDDGTEALKIRAERMRMEQLSRSNSASISHSHMDNRTLAPIRP
ncbi:hypothetical protein BROUX41_004181 [Berkeleyomyces rouxiae]|uniref:uncharacterized protein n=1 Tax=Berkeleyomyces rouxiae TaxID=2035830 RepID=UPI003B7E0AFE